MCVVCRLVRRCLISRLVAMFSCFILKDRLFNQRFRGQRCISGGMGIPVTLILSYIFVGIMPLYAINLYVISLFTDSSFTILAILNDVLYQFEWIQIRLQNLDLFSHYELYRLQNLEWIKKLPWMCVSYVYCFFLGMFIVIVSNIIISWTDWNWDSKKCKTPSEISK